MNEDKEQNNKEELTSDEVMNILTTDPGQDKNEDEKKKHNARLLGALLVIAVLYGGFMFLLNSVNKGEPSVEIVDIDQILVDDAAADIEVVESGSVDVVHGSDQSKYTNIDYGISFEFPSTYTFQTDVSKNQDGTSVHICLLAKEIVPECDSYIEVVKGGDMDHIQNVIDGDYGESGVVKEIRSVHINGELLDAVFWDIPALEEYGRILGYTDIILFSDGENVSTVSSDNETIFNHIIETWGK